MSMLTMILLAATMAGEAAAGPAVGTQAPDFSLRSDTGQMIRLSEQWPKGVTVLVFYRGYW